MAMVNLPAARRHHRSRIGYALGLLALLGATTALLVVARYPAVSEAQELREPVPAPEITVAGAGDRPPTDPTEPGWPVDEPLDPAPTPDTAGAGGGAEALTGVGGGGTTAGDVSRSLFYSGLLGLTISLAGLGLVGTRRRQW
ncbi:hypothetical protein MRQ36_13240 [Micromonospora sp. R77]|uniref:hypothetical protein n=1 Tax=Micromonospora sp. R77 TaxID=2925836 RepID=UPI001F620984|nr:hypothetical protein [Micromonospora sp. R77]MCI4063491.1 hypothetical protein [Micromonospora sp. R77]